MPDNKKPSGTPEGVIYKSVDENVLNQFERSFAKTQDYSELAKLFPSLGDERGVQAAVEFINTKKQGIPANELYGKFPEFPGLKKKVSTPKSEESLPPKSESKSLWETDPSKVKLEESVDPGLWETDPSKVKQDILDAPVTTKSKWETDPANVKLVDPIVPKDKFEWTGKKGADGSIFNTTIDNAPIKAVLNKKVPMNDEERLQLYDKALANLGVKQKAKEVEIELLTKDFESANQTAEQESGAIQETIKAQIQSKYKPQIDQIQNAYKTGKIDQQSANAELGKLNKSFNDEFQAEYQKQIAPIQAQLKTKSDIYKQKFDEYTKIAENANIIQEGVNATFLKRKIIAEGDSYLTDLANVINTGATSVIASVLRTPASFYDIARAVENKILPESFKVTTKGSEMFPNFEKAAESWNKYGEALATNARIKYQGSVEDAFDKGNYLDAAAKTGLQIAESLPITLQIGMMYASGNARGLASANANLNTIWGASQSANLKRIWNVAQFGGMKANELQKEYGLSDDNTALLAVPLGITEQFFEETGTIAMTGALANIVKKALQEKGTEAAIQVAKKGFRASFEKTFARYYPVLGPIWEGVSEAETQFADNMIMKLTGKAPDLKLSEGVFDSFVTGTGTGALMSTPVAVAEQIISLKNRAKVKALKSKEAELKAIIDGLSSQATKDFTADVLGKENEALTDAASIERDALHELSKDDINEIKPLVDETAKLNTITEDVNAPDNVKKQAEAKIEENLSVIDNWLSGKKEEKKVEAEAVVEQEKAIAEGKKMFQGREFMEATGLNPGYYTLEEVEKAKANKVSAMLPGLGENKPVEKTLNEQTLKSQEIKISNGVDLSSMKADRTGVLQGTSELQSEAGLKYGLTRVVEGYDESSIGAGNRYKGSPDYGFNLVPDSETGDLFRSDGVESATSIKSFDLTKSEQKKIKAIYNFSENPKERKERLREVEIEIANRLLAEPAKPKSVEEKNLSKELVEYDGVDYEVHHENGKVDFITKPNESKKLIGPPELIKGVKEAYEREYVAPQTGPLKGVEIKEDNSVEVKGRQAEQTQPAQPSEGDKVTLNMTEKKSGVQSDWQMIFHDGEWQLKADTKSGFLQRTAEVQKMAQEKWAKQASPEFQKKAELAHSLYKKMFEYYNKGRRANPNWLVGDGYEYAAKEMVDKEGITQDLADYLEQTIQYMGSGYVESIERFKDLYNFDKLSTEVSDINGDNEIVLSPEMEVEDLENNIMAKDGTEPNENGVFSKSKPVFTNKSKDGEVNIYALQLADDTWISSYDYMPNNLSKYAGSSGPLTARETFETEKEAMQNVLESLNNKDIDPSTKKAIEKEFGVIKQVEEKVATAPDVDVVVGIKESVQSFSRLKVGDKFIQVLPKKINVTWENVEVGVKTGPGKYKIGRNVYTIDDSAKVILESDANKKFTPSELSVIAHVSIMGAGWGNSSVAKGLPNELQDFYWKVSDKMVSAWKAGQQFNIGGAKYEVGVIVSDDDGHNIAQVIVLNDVKAYEGGRVIYSAGTVMNQSVPTPEIGETEETEETTELSPEEFISKGVAAIGMNNIVADRLAKGEETEAKIYAYMAAEDVYDEILAGISNKEIFSGEAIRKDIQRKIAFEIMAKSRVAPAPEINPVEPDIVVDGLMGVNPTDFTAEWNSKKNPNLTTTFQALTGNKLLASEENDFITALLSKLSSLGIKLNTPIVTEALSINVTPIPVNPKKNAGVKSVSDIYSTDPLREALSSILFDEGNIVATDASKLVIVKRTETDEEVIKLAKEAAIKTYSKTLPLAKATEVVNKIFDKIESLDGTAINMKTGSISEQKYPNYKSVIPEHANKTFKTNIQDLINLANGAVFAFKNASKTGGAINFNITGSLNLNIGVNANFLLETLQALQANGAKLVVMGFSEANKAITIETDNGNFGLVMPLMLQEGKGLNRTTPIQLVVTENENKPELTPSQIEDAEIKAGKRTLVGRRIISDIKPIETTSTTPVKFDIEVSKGNTEIEAKGIEGKLFTNQESKEYQELIESKYSDVPKFGQENEDIRQKLFNYDNPIAEKDINGVNVRIAEGLIEGEIGSGNRRKTYLLYADGKVVGKFYSTEDAKAVVKLIETNLVKEIDSKPINDDAKKLMEELMKLREMTRGNFNSGINPEHLAQGVKVIALYVKMGVLKFNDIAKEAYTALGESAVEMLEVMKKAYNAFVDMAESTIGFSTREQVNKFKYENKTRNPIDEGNAGRGTDSATIGTDAEQSQGGIEPIDLTEGQRGNAGNDPILQEQVPDIQQDDEPTTGAPGSNTGTLRPTLNDSAIQHNWSYPSNYVRNSNKSFNRAKSYADNIAALEVILEILKSGNSYASTAQKEILANYNGLGSLSEILFSDNSEGSQWTPSTLEVYEESRQIRALIKEIGEIVRVKMLQSENLYQVGQTVSFEAFKSGTGAKAKNISAGKGKIIYAGSSPTGFSYTVNVKNPVSGKMESISVDEAALTLVDSKATDTAEQSTQYAYYTDLPVIRAMWAAVKAAGFNGGRVLEGSVGSGRYIGGMPKDLQNTTKFTGIDMDVTSALVAKYLYPKAKIVNSPIQRANVASGAYDLFISNIPFSKTGQYDSNIVKRGPLWDAARQTLHGYYVAKAIDSVRLGGLIQLISSTGVLDAPTNNAVRELMAQECDFVGAVRMPATTFQADSNTQVTTDIIMLRKKVPGEPSVSDQSFVEVGKMTIEHRKASQGPIDVSINQYFINNPKNVLGEMKGGNPLYGGKTGYTLEGPTIPEAELAEMLSEMAKEFKITKPVVLEKDLKNTMQMSDLGRMVAGGIVEKNGNFFEVIDYDQETGKSSVEPITIPKPDAPIVTAFVKARNLYFEVLALDAMNKDAAAKREELKTTLATFLRVIAPSSIKRLVDSSRKVSKILVNDPDFYSLSSLVNDDGTYSDFVNKPLEKADLLEKTDSPADAVTFSINTKGVIDLPLIAKLLSIPEDQVIDKIKDFVFETPDGEVIMSSMYLSGNVREKLEQAKEWALVDSKFQRNADELEKVIPKDMDASEITFTLGANWIPSEIVDSFLNIMYGDTIEAIYLPSANKWNIRQKYSSPANSITVTQNFPDGEKITKTAQLEDILEVAFNKASKEFTQTYKDGEETITYKLTQLQEAVAEKASQIQERFEQFVKTEPSAKKEATNIFNKIFNAIKLIVHDGSKLTFPGMQGYGLNPHQKDAIMSIIMNFGGMIDHEVGLGKSLVMSVAAIKMKQMGLVNKPVITTKKSVLPGMLEQVRRQYPTAKILCPDSTDFSPARKQLLFAKIKNNDWDVIIITHENLAAIPLPEEFEAQFIADEVAELEQAIEELTSTDQTGATGQMTKKQIKALQGRIEKLNAELQEIQDRGDNASRINFGDMGLDFLFVDESQDYKNLSFITKLYQVAGLGNPAGSKKATMMKMVARYLQQLHGGDKGIVFASGTPISNSIVEVYSILQYLRPSVMKSMAINSLDQFVDLFASVDMVAAPNVAGVIKIKQRLNRFVNMTALSTLYREISDVRGAFNTYIERPEILGGKPKLVMVEPDDFATTIIEAIYEASETASLEPLMRVGLSVPDNDNQKKALGLLLTGIGKKLAIDYRMLFPNAAPPKRSKITAMTDEVTRIYNETTDELGTQLIFSDLGVPKSKSDSLGSRLQTTIEDMFDSSVLADMNLKELYALKVGQDELAIPILMSKFEMEMEEAQEILNTANDFTSFNVYQEIKDQLIAKGVPADEIDFIHNHKTDLQKDILFKKVQNGEIRVLLGSTGKLGTGVNVQDRIVGLHHLEMGWRPSDFEQRNGRGIRRGNNIKSQKVAINVYGMEDSMDAFILALVGKKQLQIESFRNGTSGNIINMEDGEAMSHMEHAAALSNDTRLLDMEKIKKSIRGIKNTIESVFMANKLREKNISSAIEAINIVKKSIVEIEQFKNDLQAKKIEVEEPVIKEGVIQVDKEGNTKMQKASVWAYRAGFRGFSYDTSIKSERNEFFKKLSEYIKSNKKEYDYRETWKNDIVSFQIGKNYFKVKAVYGGGVEIITDDTFGYGNIGYNGSVTSGRAESSISKSTKGDPIELRSAFTRFFNDLFKDDALDTRNKNIQELEDYLDRNQATDILPTDETLPIKVEELEAGQREIQNSINADMERTGTKKEKVNQAVSEFVVKALTDVFTMTDVVSEVVTAPFEEWASEVGINLNNEPAEDTELLTDSFGDIYGAYYNGVLYMDPSRITPGKAMHEFGHAFSKILRERAPDVWARGLELIESEGQEYVDAVRLNPRYKNLSKPDQMEEALMAALTDSGQKLSMNKKLLFSKWLAEVWNSLKDFFGLADVTGQQLKDMTLQQFVGSMAKTMFDPEQIAKLMERAAKKEGMKNPMFGVDPSKFGVPASVWEESIGELKSALADGKSPQEAIQAAIDLIDSYDVKWDRQGFTAELAAAFKIPLWAKEVKMRKSAQRAINELPFSAQTIEGLTERAMYYTQISKALTTSEAYAVMQRLGLEQARLDVLDAATPISNRNRIGLSMAVIEELGKQQRYEEQSDFMGRVFELGTDLGQAVDAFKLLGAMGVDGLVYQAQRDNTKAANGWLSKNQATFNKIKEQMRGINKDVAEQIIEELAKEFGLVSKATPKEYGSTNRVVTKSAYEAAKAAIARSRGTLSSGVNLAELVVIAAYHVEASGRDFASFAKAMVGDLGTTIIPELKSLYEKGRNQLTDNGVELVSFLSNADLSTEEITSIFEAIQEQYISEMPAASTTLEQKLEEKGVKDAKNTAKKIEEKFEQKASKPKGEALRKQKGMKDASFIVSMSNKGMNDIEFTKAFLQSFGKILTPEQIKEIRRLSENINSALSEPAKFRATKELMDYQANLQGTDWSEVALNMWFSSVLSGYTTQEINILQTGLNTVLDTLVTSVNNPKGMPLFARALLNGTILGLSEFGDIMTTGSTPIKGKLEVSGILERVRFAGGRFNPLNWAKYVRRFMIASDVVFFEGQKEMRTAQLAWRIAMAEGKTTPDMSVKQKAIEIMNYRSQDIELAKTEAEDLKSKSIDLINSNPNLTEAQKNGLIKLEKNDFNKNVSIIVNNKRRLNKAGDIVEMASEQAARGTYNSKPTGVFGWLASAINTAKNRSKANLENSTNIGGKITWGTVTVITNFVVPFTNVIANVFNATIEYSPLGAITALSPKGNTELEKNISRDEAMTKALIGTVALVSLLVLSSGDDDDEETIQITARGAGDYKQNYTLNEIGWQPYSIRINGTWYSYQYTPLFLALSIVGNVNDYRRYRGSEGIDADLEASLVFSLKQVIPQMFQTTFLQGLTDFAEKAMSEKPLEGGIEKLLAKQAYGFVPNIYKQAFSEYQNAFDIPEKNTSNSIRAMFVQDIPVASWGRNSLTDKINVLGDPIIPDTDKITSKVESNPLFKLLIDKQAFLVAPRLSTSKIIVDGKERPMTDEEFYNYSKARGQAMKNYLEANYAVLVEQNQSQAKKIIKKMWEKFGEQQKNILEYSLN